MSAPKRRGCNPLSRAATESEITGATLLPPPGHAFWRQRPDDVAAQTHLAVTALERERAEAVGKALNAQEVRPRNAACTGGKTVL